MRSLLLAIIAACLAPSAYADRFALRYDGAGLGFVPLGDIVIDAYVSDESYRINAALRSGGLLNLFEPTNIQAAAAGRIEGGGVHWERYDLDHQYSRKRRGVVMTNAADVGVIAEITPNYRLWGEPPATDEQRRLSRDPLSTLIAMAIDVGQTRHCAGAYPVFDGRFHYLLELAGGEIDSFAGGGYEGEVLKCELAYIAVSGFEARDAGRRRIPHGNIWFALAPDTTFAPPVRVSTPLSAGGAVIRLTSWRRAVVDVIAATP